MCSKAFRLSAGLLLIQLSLCGRVSAQETNEFLGVDKGAHWQLRGVASLPAKARIELAQTGAPIWRTVDSKQGSTLRQIMAEVCGEQPSEALDFLLAEAARLNLISGPDDLIEKDVAIAVPFCLKVDRNVTVEIKSGDTLEKILDENYGISGRRTLHTTYEANKKKFRATSFNEFASNLPVGKKLLLPLTAEPRVFAARPDLDVTLPEILEASDLSASVRSQVENSVAPVEEPSDRGEFQFSTIESVEFGGAQANCAADGQVASVVNLELLKERFAIEEQAKKVVDKLDPQPVVVGIIDSGLAEVGDSFFQCKFFATNLGEFQKRPDVDDDNNDRVDDVYGINFNKDNGEIRPYPTSGKMKSHGTKMAALILGGPEVAAGWSNARPTPLLQLKVVNFASSTQISANVAPPYLGEAINYLVKQQARIINISLANDHDISGVRQAIALAPHVLFVVAAGNAKIGTGRGLNINIAKVYLARYGGREGEHNEHVVTVGAANLSGKRATFSNYSNQYVDFLAPGCAVETRDDLGATVLDSGTSPATAITTFASALVASLGIKMDAKAIKNRLLLSTDFDPVLSTDFDPGSKDHSWSSGRLNIVKAISLRNDVIQLASSGYLFTKIDHSSLRSFCGDPEIRADLSNLRKVVPNIPSSQGQKIWFWIEVDDRLERVFCPQANPPGDDNIRLLDGSPGPSLADIQDITVASYR